jgi:hypothetical protein
MVEERSPVSERWLRSQLARVPGPDSRGPFPGTQGLLTPKKTKHDDHLLVYTEQLLLCAFRVAFNTMHVHETTFESTRLPSGCTKIVNLNSSKRWMEHGADVSFEKTRECDGRC